MKFLLTYRFIGKVLGALLLSLVLLATTSWGQNQNSVLASGKWFKIGVTQTGVYRLDAPFFKKLGIPLNEINPKNIRLFGNGGYMLPQSNAQNRASDLTENAVFVKGENDGKFDEGDALWFWGQSPHEIRYNTAEKRLKHQLNLYADTTFYFLQLDATQAGLRLSTYPSGNSGAIQTTFDDYVFRESEIYNRVQSGREWWGEYFGNQTRQDFSADLEGLLPNSPVKVTVASVAAAQVTTKFVVGINGQTLGEQTMGTVTTYRYDSKGLRTQKTYDGQLSNATTRVTTSLTFDKAGQANAEGYLDFFGLQIQRSLRLYTQPTVFQSLASLTQDSVRYQISQANAQMQLWDVTNPLRPAAQSFRLSGTEAIFGTSGKILRRFVAFSETQLLTPISAQAVSNQNLRTLSTPNLLIITSPIWLKQAQRLATFRRQNDGLDVIVVTTNQVYNEFASGQADPTAIRDYAKLLNNRQPNTLKYLLLFGDATYDYKNNLKAFSPLEMTYFVPSYESRESGHPVLSFTSDDYFGFLKPTDGEWIEDFSGNHLLDIGVGRLPVKTTAEAETVVDKLIRYVAKRSRGKWQQKIAFVADDGDANLHQQDAENLSTQIASKTTSYELQKVYVDAFPQIGTPVHAPEASKTIDKLIDEGVLIMNYTGHGGISIWADEQIVTLQNILNWRNLDNLPLMITATCEFGRYDNPGEVSGAELAVLSPRGGAIAMLTTARPVYASTNFLLNEAFYESALERTSGDVPRLGDLMRMTKNKSFSGIFNRNFTLLGDPSLRLNYPDFDVEITTQDTLKAGGKARISGQIKLGNAIVNDFNGVASISVFDKENQLMTLGSEDSKMPYKQFKSKIFEGKVSIKNGLFAVDFVVPKNIDTKLGNGLVQVYAINADSSASALGGSRKVVVGGINTNLNDTQPPVVQLYLNDENFVEGSQVDDSPLFIANLSDDNGINVLQPMTLTLNDTLSVVVNDYFSASQDNFKRGTIRYPLKKLPTGDYLLRLKVADTYTNWNESTLSFKIGKESAIVKNIIAYPNPFVEQATLQVELVNEGEDVEVTTTIFDVSGNLVRSETQTIYNSDDILTTMTWNAATHYRQPVPAGVYVYRVTVKSLTRQQAQTVGGKLIKPK
ncbi:type IX secretion system sortase PorU [Runella sp. SP2]|uniref:type IX secretion system sortase PorU n=1 Tax=Runella sp. SP2 TaxID=2268026 RepID=UPI000F07CFA6|nr:type IX secretion system sortase PorU [Runella sp. SP2]AYQ33485.1 T9SS C-terminal target domain-containing protein [Runella sp. SP2]